MSYKLYLGPIAEAWLVAHGLDAWQAKFNPNQLNSEGKYATIVSEAGDDQDAVVQLFYGFSSLSNNGQLSGRVMSPKTIVEDSVSIYPRPSARIDVVTQNLPHTVLASLHGKTLDRIIEGEDWLAPALRRYRYDRKFERNDRLELYSSYLPKPAYVTIAAGDITSEPPFGRLSKIKHRTWL